MTTTILLASGKTREIAYDVSDDYPVLGVDADGRVVRDMGGYTFATTLCCDAFDKGMEDGVGCRACYGIDGGPGERRDGTKVPVSDSGVYDAEVADVALTVTVRSDA